MVQRIIFILLFPVFAFANLQIELSMNAKVKTAQDDKFTDKKSGDVIDLNNGDIIFVVPEKQLPMILVGANPNVKKVTINPIDVSESFSDVVNLKVQEATDNIVSEIKKIELLIKKQDISGAQGRVSSLKLQYPKISQVLFLSATISYLSNNKDQAIEELNKGLAIDPNDESAKQFLKKLEARRP